MKVRTTVLCSFALAAAIFIPGCGKGTAKSTRDVSASLIARAHGQYRLQTLRFERNAGQLNPEVRYVSRGKGHHLFLMKDSALLSFVRDGQSAAIRLRPAGANPKAQPAAEAPVSAPGHSLMGSGVNDVAASEYERVRYASIYRGIDLLYFGDPGRMQYDFVVAPNANPAAIRLEISGVDSASVEADGALLLRTEAGDLRMERPVAYQQHGEARKSIHVAYNINADGTLVFRLGRYEPSLPLTIDL